MDAKKGANGTYVQVKSCSELQSTRAPDAGWMPTARPLPSGIQRIAECT